LWDVDPDLSLRILWEGLKTAEDLGLGRQYHDVTDWLGFVLPYTSPDECLGHTVGNTHPEPEKAIQALWALARTQQRQGHRDAVLESLAEMLLRQENVSQAVGVAALLFDPARQTKVWTAVAIVAHGKRLRLNW
jgi:hypothetical protein